MLEKNIENQTIALAAVHQSCWIIEKISWNGEYSTDSLMPLIHSIFKIDSTSIQDIYGDISKLTIGLKHLKDEITNITNNYETKKYFKDLIYLADGLSRRTDISVLIQNTLQEYNQIIKQENPTIIEQSEKLSSLYLNTLSKIEPRIVITGDNKYLTIPKNASIIRTALFAGLRAVYLWKQSGGTRIKLFFFKSKIKNQINNYMGC
ncbi:MAG: hypothetical protein CMD88_01845 [Gammaproteobacteria bacterium]|nr:hypothetical protein [Gammaproteobacteria bacterium]|tara:strand:- start:505 stop:1122 length:618 start_codon:yes stop_codon:yes gene_type:complete